MTLTVILAVAPVATQRVVVGPGDPEIRILHRYPPEVRVPELGCGKGETGEGRALNRECPHAGRKG